MDSRWRGQHKVFPPCFQRLKNKKHNLVHSEKNGTLDTIFEDIDTKGILHFQNLFKVDQRSTIESILKVENVFPSFVNQEQNESLMA